MKFQFDPNQKYQLDAVSAITSLFKGQTAENKPLKVDKGKISGMADISHFSAGYIAGYGNKLTLSDEEMNKNLKMIRDKNFISSSETIKSKGKNFSVEMETGTGKTYIYLRTIFELNKKYSFSKFIIVVPSVAVREGVLKSLKIMKSHFKTLYSGILYKEFVYQSKKTSVLRDFATGNNLQIMIINIDAFNKDKNIIHSERDQMGGVKPIEFVKAVHPIVLIDEAQNMESEKSKEAISSLNPLCTLRYSATHKNLYNLVYRLDPVQAFQKKLVKKISVASVVEENDPTRSYIKVLKIVNKNNKITCTLQFFKNTSEGRKQTKKVCRQHDDLFIHSKENYMYKNGFKITEINCRSGMEFVRFANGIKMPLGQEQGGSREEVIKIQIKETIKAHFEKENQLKGQGIKVLSLFFLDRVENYRVYKKDAQTLGLYGKWFEEMYKEVSEGYKKNLNVLPVSQVHNGYFSKDRKGTVKNTKGNTKEDADTYSLIMKDKEKLLDINNPLKFIFSHSALREGWDNPNIFQICTLNETGSIIKKRQEIGRGLRLPVNQKGERVQDDLINHLTVVANESYNDFVSNLQKEMEEECGFVFGALPIKAFVVINFEHAGKEHKITLEESKKLWNHLKKLKYLSEDGVITKEFNNAVKENTFFVPENFKIITNEVIQIVEQYQMERHIQKYKSRKKIKLNKDTLLDPEFKKFWDKISQKTFYSVYYDTQELIEKSGKAIKNMEAVQPVKITVDKADIEMEHKALKAQLSQTPTYIALSNKIKLPDILNYIQEKISITKKTIFNILERSGRWNDFCVNPQKFMDMAVTEIQCVLHSLIIEGIKYEKLNKVSYEMSRFYEDEQKMEFMDDKIIPTKKSVYDYIYYESPGVEKPFAEALEKLQNIKYFIKLPRWFKVKTPVGDYNPDWAILKQNGDIVYMIRETKGAVNKGALRGLEKDKIKCGQKHFTSIGVNYKVCTSVKDADL